MVTFLREEEIKWSTEEIKILNDNFRLAPKNNLLELLPKRNWDGIKHKASRLGIQRMFRCWRPELDEALRIAYLSQSSTTEISNILGRRNIHNRASQLGLKRPVKLLIMLRTVKLTEKEKGYVAGIIDGEGTITFANMKKKRPTPKITLANTNFELIDYLQRIIGGQIVYPKKHPDRKAVAVLNIQGLRNCLPLLMSISQDLIVKKKHAQLMLDWCDVRYHRDNWNQPQTEKERSIVAELRDLNQKKGRRLLGDKSVPSRSINQNNNAKDISTNN